MPRNLTNISQPVNAEGDRMDRRLTRARAKSLEDLSHPPSSTTVNPPHPTPGFPTPPLTVEGSYQFKGARPKDRTTPLPLHLTHSLETPGLRLHNSGGGKRPREQPESDSEESDWGFAGPSSQTRQGVPSPRQTHDDPWLEPAATSASLLPAAATSGHPGHHSAQLASLHPSARPSQVLRRDLHPMPQPQRVTDIPNALAPDPFYGRPNEDARLWLACFEQFASVKGWSEATRHGSFPLFLKERARQWYEDLPSSDKRSSQAMREAFLKRYTPHPSMKWVNLRLFHERRQLPTEPVEDFFAEQRKAGRELGKSETDIMETIVGGLLPQISKFVMLRAPRSVQEALDLALTAQVLETPTSDTTSVHIAELTDKIGQLGATLDEVKRRMERPPGISNPNRSPQWSNNQNFRRTGGPGSPRGTDRGRQGPQWQQTRPQPLSPFSRQSLGCYACGGGHQTNFCRFKTVKCHNCGRIGHLSRVCRSRPQPRQ